MDVVVATTVIEVGVDLPNATMMVVLGAERFGLAQLHQLRGRVGRGTKKSYCVLITHNRIPPFAQDRMRILERTRDGFEIAEEDCRLRGPGEYFGTRQTGHLNFRLADPIHDSDLLKDANLAAIALYEGRSRFNAAPAQPSQRRDSARLWPLRFQSAFLIEEGRSEEPPLFTLAVVIYHTPRAFIIV